MGFLVNRKANLHTTFIDSDTECLGWLKINNAADGKPTIWLGVVYIPPEQSAYSSIQMFEDLQSEILKISCTSDSFCIVGDFNARTGSESDMLPVNSHIYNLMNDVGNINVHLNDQDDFDKLHIPKERRSKDKIVNNYGKHLLSLCKDMNLVILNGRCCNDKVIGEFTCKDASVVDYALVSIENYNIDPRNDRH